MRVLLRIGTPDQSNKNIIYILGAPDESHSLYLADTVVLQYAYTWQIQ